MAADNQESRSAWCETAPEPQPFPELASDARTGVLIVGAGYTGLSAAHHLAARGVDCMVIEAHQPGWGASGRNGGMLVPRPKKPLTAIEAHWGRDEALRQRRLLHEAIETVCELVADHGIDCDFAQDGYLAAAHTPKALDALAAEVRWLHQAAGETEVQLLSRAEISEELGGGAYCGGYLDPLGARVQPLAYARGLASSLAARGVPIHGSTPATRVRAIEGGIAIDTPRATVTADQLVIATNGYTPPGLFPDGLAQRVVAVSSSAIATAPLPRNLAGRILPRGRTMSDTKHLLNWVRLSPDNRIVFGGRGDITGRRADAASYKGIEDALHALYPDLADVPVTHRWSGLVAVTRDHWHHLGSLSPRIHFAMGYGGRGVAMSTLMGRYLARLAVGEACDLGPVTAAFPPVPFHALRIPGMKLTAAWYQAKDRLGL
ncbi:NAD(P)/FAD-dependent oxidoreductase [Futiania mangrovi]|uniref:FAD-binding oxidoreductase n=1 Tax=Futiania mangrovi TaxID=2959716 RepID=A0A9J6PF63_9PROT|nr:FAD-binding oxidoreductase [Futiania mangrovii]MCP1337094.1 FAD-binding oxidoreductase [Futiania mangrovii]